MPAPTLKVAICSLGAIGIEAARALDQGITGLELVCVSAKDRAKAEQNLSSFQSKPRIVELEEAAEIADVVVECAPAALYDRIVRPTIARGRILVTMSSGALLTRPDLIEQAKATGARIMIPSGGILGLDALKAAAEGTIHSVKLISRKPPPSLEGAPFLVERGISVRDLPEAKRVFQGSAREAAQSFPANANVAATLSLAGIGPDRTQVEIWADPAIRQNMQTIEVRAEAADFDLRLASHPLAQNPRTGSLTPKSLISTLRSLRSQLTIGSA